LVLIGGVFVVEAGSVLVQVAAHKWTGRRVFRCAPLHHHFELAGWTERTIVVRFWIAASLCAALGVAVGLLN
jgi:phospho-N-acetylmuramoyl-pentapeptide-transferase